MSLNAQQKKIVETLDGSINVAAGAGTGKTFTLTQRIVEAVKRRLRDCPGDADPSGHILAITFTNKAASELKSRVRLAFLDEAKKGGELGERYFKCALSIDNAWIGTIHGMAGRILRENAIDFHIDPGFEILTEQQENVLLSQAIEEAFMAALSSDDDDMKDYLHSHDLAPVSRFESSLADQIGALLDTVSYMPGGLDGVRVLGFGSDLYKVSMTFLKGARKALLALQECVFTPAAAIKADGYIAKIQEAIPHLENWVEATFDNVGAPREADTYDASKAADQLLPILAEFPRTSDKFGAKTEFAESFHEYRALLKGTYEGAISNLAAAEDEMFIKFAKQVEARLREIKSAGLSKMSQSDVLVMCDYLLGLPEHAGIARGYQDKFDLVMLDEFQDTDKLQMSLIGKLAKADTSDPAHPLMANLCTVGDMQQSIYRFRGGDVEQSRIRMRSLEGGRGLQMELSSNYRSHKAVLDAVELIFSREDVFGSEFLKLDAASETLDGKCVEIFESVPRVTFDFVHGGKAGDGTSYGIGSARQEAAKRIAAHFRELADKGVAPSDMALLLGGMPNASIYADAIRDMGIECAITAGSQFAEMPETRTIAQLLNFASNPKDDAALFQVLVSDLFAISDDDLLRLCRVKRDGKVAKRALSSALFAFQGEKGEAQDRDRAVLFAKEALSDFAKEARLASPSRALRSLFAKSGLLFELERKGDAQSLVSAGTIKKAIGIVAELESQCSGASEVAFNFEVYLSDAKETPGTLVKTSSDFVQILTIHSSKGLEFKHVAVAEMRDGIAEHFPQPFYLENIDDDTYLAFKTSRIDIPSYDAKKEYEAICKFGTLKAASSIGSEDGDPSLTPSKSEAASAEKEKIKAADSHIALEDAIGTYTKTQELEEARRLMYVALTRARESLFVSAAFKGAPERGYIGVYLDIVNAMTSYFDVAEEALMENFSYTKLPIAMNRVALASEEMRPDLAEEPDEDGNGTRDAAPPPQRLIPVYGDQVEVVPVPSELAQISEGLYSYSMLVESRPELQLAEEDVPYFMENSLFDDFYVEDEFLMMTDALSGANPFGEDDPLSLGIAFHRLAQASVIETSARAGHVFDMPAGCTVSALGRALGLSDSQKERLQAAMELWLGSSLAKRLAKHEQVIAEVPFNVEVRLDGRTPGGGFVLNGEIDALATNGGTHAFFVDYKTGNRDRASEGAFRRKFEFQAKCYAYALLESGFDDVEANFVLVEQPVHASGDAQVEPMCIAYSFSSSDAPALKSEIIEAYERYIDEHGR